MTRICTTEKIFIILYNAALIVGSCYVVFVLGHPWWWLLIAALLLMSTDDESAFEKVDRYEREFKSYLKDKDGQPRKD